MDLNRQLSDYRTNTAAPLAPGNMGKSGRGDDGAAELRPPDFARLVIAAGAATVDPNTGNVAPLAGIMPDQFAALRYLAQLAVNIVDYIDDDDIATPFIWNPTGGTGLIAYTDPTPSPNPTSYPPVLTANLASQTVIQNSVVFGVEKPRLVINEAYSETTNSPQEANPTAANPARQPARVRFGVELLNPTPSPLYTTGTGPLGTGANQGAVQLYYPAVPGPGGNPAYSPYKLVITRAVRGGIDVGAVLRDPSNPLHAANVTGDLPGGMPGEIEFGFNSGDITGTPAKQIVVPNNGNPGPLGVASSARQARRLGPMSTRTSRRSPRTRWGHRGTR